MPASAIEIVKSAEGLRLSPYLCPAAVWTIGYGATYDGTGARVTASTASISESEAETFLARDMEKAARGADRLLTVPLLPDQRGALASWIFNLGSGAFRASTLRQKINENAGLDEIEEQWLKWVYAGGRKLRGLELRRKAEFELWANA